jgi:hypothetical protein
MNQGMLFKEDLELNQLLESEGELARRQREIDEARRRIAEERAEQERTIPPLEEIQARIQRRKHEEIVSRGEIANIRRDQNRSLMMLALLIAATAALVWWGLRLMQGG